MGIFSKIKFQNRKARKEVSEWLQDKYWSLSGLSKFLEEKGIQIPVYVEAYDFSGRKMYLRSNSGQMYTSKLVTAVDGCSEIWITRSRTTYKYAIGCWPTTYVRGKILQIGEQHRIESMYEEEYCIYEYYVGAKSVLRIELYNPTDTIQDANAVETWLHNYFNPCNSNSADEILKGVLDSAGFSAEDSDEVFIKYTPSKATEKEIYTKIRQICGVLIEFEAEKKGARYSGKNRVYQYTDNNGQLVFDLNAKTYRIEMSWKDEMPNFLKDSVFTKFDELERKLESIEE